MGWFHGTASRRLKWALVAAGLLSTSCAGVIGAGAAAVFVGAGILTYTCYDRVSVTVTDRLTGANLCDAKVTFIKGTSETVATSCYTAALSTGKYVLRVERRGLETFEEPVEVSKDGACGQTVQTMFVALDRKNGVQAPQRIEPPAAAGAVTVPPAATAPPGAVTVPPATTASPGAVTAPPGATPPGAVTVPPATTAAPPPSASAAPAPAPAPSSSFPDAP